MAVKHAPLPFTLSWFSLDDPTTNSVVAVSLSGGSLS
jgi:hypothetical protein